MGITGKKKKKGQLGVKSSCMEAMTKIAWAGYFQIKQQAVLRAPDI